LAIRENVCVAALAQSGTQHAECTDMNAKNLQAVAWRLSGAAMSHRKAGRRATAGWFAGLPMR